MTRILVFEGERASKRFDMLHLALLSAGNGKGERTREVYRREARLLDALDTVSDSLPNPTSPDARVLKSQGGTVELEQADFALLSSYVDTAQWAPRVSRDACDLMDWLSASAQQEKP